MQADDAVNLQDYKIVGAAADGKLYEIEADGALDADGAAIVSTLESGDTDFGDPVRTKTVCGMFLDVPRITGQTLQLYVSARRTLSDAIEWKGPFVYRGRGRMDFMATGVWFRFKFVKSGGDFALRGYHPLWQLRGER
jgi:hypothetical protein